MAGNNALAKLYSWADGVKRRARNPMQTLALGLTQANEDLQQAATDADIAYGRNGMKSVLLSQQQRDEAAKRAAQFGEQMAMAAATVYHGSPHKFNKFDSSKIGTGEGAQAYGHGLYLAESDKVAKQYQQKLGAGNGSLYKVDLPDEAIAKMLDWDTPLSQQPQAFKDAVSAREQQRMMPILEQRRATLAGLPQGAENASILKKQIAILEDEITQPQAVPNMTGGEYFNYLRNREMAPAEQADWLRKAGIPGIRYLDGGSRSAGAGSSNFVVFPGNEGLLKILERNGGKP